ncbi:patatin-like phospholipase family protein [Glaciecola sp. XM2]|uniref:patatin-like phospholipase family protein n=1 Tax=Glaciecola sp. XM2 TaxID=1914931 RepID=UPI001BDEEDC9|nr:patatin-like phospholipase family protein [Glaciecola sp. XM2]MBT1451474.1 patatin-like phospholipase family protein [Glaciecola sp. XM2]
MSNKQKIGLALGSGSSRGWSHVGIIKELNKLGVEPDIICGTSVGAMVGAAYAKGNMDRLAEWACSLTKLDVARFVDINTSMKGFVDIKRFHGFLTEYIAGDDDKIEDLPKTFAAVATDMYSGREIWLTQGSIVQAVWASMSLPGLFPVIKNEDRWLTDGGLVNPVPVSVCRALGADIVIAVNLNGDIVGKHVAKSGVKEIKKEQKHGFTQKVSDLVEEYTSFQFSGGDENQEQAPSLLNAIAASVNITQDRITRSRMAGDPPDIVFAPKLSHIGLLELYRAQEAIEEGKKCVQRNSSELEYVLGR